MDTLKKYKYWIISIAFLVWILFIDDSNVLSWMSLKSENASIKKEQEFYDSEYYNVERLLMDIKTNNDSIEYYARETFYMKKKDEVIYIIE